MPGTDVPRYLLGPCRYMFIRATLGTYLTDTFEAVLETATCAL